MSHLRSLSLGIALALSAGAVCLMYPTPADSAVNRAAEEPPEPSGFELTPPALEAISITPTPQSQEGDALLQFKYVKGQDLPADIPINVDDKQVKLVRDDKDPQLYRAAIPFDFEGFIKEQEERKRSADEKDTAPQFDGRLMLADETVRFLDPEQLRKQVASGLTIQVPIHIIFGPLRRVRPERSLMVVAPSVVEDPIRTFDVCTGAGNPNGAWTFNRLMTNMANQPVTGVNPSDFVENWLRTWGTSTTVNTFPVNARSQVITQVLNTWPRLSNGKLDLTLAPLRLLGIVNRVDLRTNSVYGGGSAGEGRFVFGVIRRNSNGSCTTHRFTVILEYGVPINGCPAVRSYAQQWGNLGTMVLGSPAYNSALQAITDQFTSANAAPNKPNRSAINQIRTNEFLQSPWELREFNIVRGANQLSIVSPKQTPFNTFNTPPVTSNLLATFINNNQAAVLAETHNVPLSYLGTPFRAGAVPNPLPQKTWQHPLIANNDARNKFAVNTCDACHGKETLTGSFLHVAPRASGAQAALSQFLIGNQPGASVATPNQYSIPDGVIGSVTRNYGGDLRRRQTDLSALQNSTCRAGAIFQEAHFLPLAATH